MPFIVGPMDSLYYNTLGTSNRQIRNYGVCVCYTRLQHWKSSRDSKKQIKPLLSQGCISKLLSESAVSLMQLSVEFRNPDPHPIHPTPIAHAHPDSPD